MSPVCHTPVSEACIFHHGISVWRQPRGLIETYGSLNIDNVRFYTAEIVCGLQFLHGHIIHRDIKRDNIMLDADGHIRIIDLGLAQDGVTSSNNISGVTGTFHFMAPEVLRKRGYGTAVD
ncbi:RAC-gamma serine/threonine-protein kinase-like [Ranitomeya imitator]|uniref:RAC-gamma serine/threonine-protein kinase-like n=1 Tax=Ranitomeya imitator TaxID=111125 RepID=UPI0037E8455B